MPDVTITITRQQLLNLLAVHEERQRRDNSVGDALTFKLIEPTDCKGHSDKCNFWAQSVYGECNDHFLGSN